jgi:hypothetical protein
MHVFHCLGRAKHRAGHSGPGFVDAIVFPVAIIALDIAFGSHRKMYSTTFPGYALVETGVPAQILFHAILLYKYP